MALPRSPKPSRARFRIRNIPANVKWEELEEALEEQLVLEDIKMKEPPLELGANGLYETEVELPDEEGDLLRGPLKQAKVHIREIFQLDFQEIKSKSAGAKKATNSYFPSPPAAAANRAKPAGASSATASQSAGSRVASADASKSYMYPPNARDDKGDMEDEHIGLDEVDNQLQRLSSDRLGLSSGVKSPVVHEKDISKRDQALQRSEKEIEERRKRIEALHRDTFLRSEAADKDPNRGRDSIGPEMAMCSCDTSRWRWPGGNSKEADGASIGSAQQARRDEDSPAKTGRSCTTAQCRQQ